MELFEKDFIRNGIRLKSHTFTDFLKSQSLLIDLLSFKNIKFFAKESTTKIKTTKRRDMKQLAMVLTFLHAKDVKSKSKFKVH